MTDFQDEPTLDMPSSDVARDQTHDLGSNHTRVPVDPPAHPIFPGYDILCEVGRGGMGVVYKARHLALNRDVALKVMLAGAQAGPVELVRFRQEAEAGARLDHPNIVQVHEVGAHAGRSYLALEFVGGGDLAHKSAGVPQSPRDAARMVETLGTAVHYAHSCGVLHRDLKPANILLTPDGVPKVADFGLARRIDDASGLTATDAILGTPGYIAPEQAAGRKTVGPAADVYGLGAVLYMLLTGRPPFQGANAIEVLRRVMDDPPVPVRRLQANCPRDLDVICLKCLEKDPAKRYASAAALADDLHRHLADVPIRARPAGRLNRLRRWARRHPGTATMSGLTALLLLVIAGGGVGMSLRLKTALTDAEADRDAARRAEAEGKEKLYQSLVSEAKAERFSRRVGQRFGTLDAIRQAVALGRELDKPPAAFDELRNLAIGALALPDLRPSAEWLSEPVETGWNSAYRDVDPGFRLDAVTDPNGAVSLRRVGTGPDDRGEIARIPGFKVEARPRWSPDGRFLAVWHWQLGRLQVWRADAPAPTLGVNETNGCRAFGFSPSGDQLITVGGGLLRVYGLADGGLLRSFPRVTEAWENVAHHPRLPQVALAHANGVLLVDLETGKDVGRLSTASRPQHLTWHPDGELLAYATATHVHVWDVPRKRLNWELEHRGGGLEIAFNPAGDLLASSGWSGRTKLWNPYTGREVLRASGHIGRFGPGDRLATKYGDSWKGHAGPLTRVEAGREYRTLVAGAGRSPQVRDYRSCSVHPDGRLLALGTHEGISLMDLETGSEREFLAVPADVVLFEPTGSLLTNTRAGLFRWPVRADPAAAQSFRVGPPERVPCACPPYISRIVQSGDGTVLAGSNPYATGAFVWHRDSPGKTVRLTPHTDCRNVAIGPDGRLVATGAFGGQGLRVWDAGNGNLVREFLPDQRLLAPFFSADGRWLMNSGGQSWRVADWTEGPRHIGGEAAFSADKGLMAWGGHKGFIPLVDPESGWELARLEDPLQDVLAWLTFSPDGTLLIGSTDDSSCVRVWNLRKIRDGLKELDLDWDAKPYPPETSGQRPGPIHVEVVGAEKLITPAEPPGLALNNEAWRLVAGPPEERNPARALVLVRQALDREPGNRLYLNTLGVAEYRSGRYEEAVAALDKSLASGDGEYAAFDLYFLAMCHSRLGDLDKARDSFDRAVKWHEKKKGLSATHATELNEFRAEAKAILESDRQPRPPPGGGKP